MIKLDQARQLDLYLDDFIGKTIFYLKNKHLTPDRDNALWLEKREHFAFGHLPLENLWRYANQYKQEPGKTEKVYSLLQSIKIYLVESANHYYLFVVNNNLSIRDKNIDDTQLHRLEMHDQLVSFILKYRALWDKIMGCLIFLYYPEKYDDWLKTRSRKNRFETIFKQSGEPWEKVEPYIELLGEFDNEYRTPEAHDKGRADLKIIFEDELPFRADYCLKLMKKHFNKLIEFTDVFGQLLNYAYSGNSDDLHRIHV